jgi:recombination associated protein RdgC
MWFKNLIFHRLPADWTISAAELEGLLSRRTLQPCGPFDMISRGWVPVVADGRLLHTVNTHHMIALGVDQKLLPASIIRQVADERAAVLAREQGFPVGRRQRRELRLRVGDELRARALTRRRITRAWIDAGKGWIAVDAAGAARAEEVVETLGETLGSFAPRLVETAVSPQAAMRSWLMAGEAPLGFTIEDDLELKAADKSNAVIRYTRHPLDGKEIRAHLCAGKYPTRLGLTWRDRVVFVLSEKLQLKRLQFLEMSKDEGADDELDAAERFDIDFTVMAGELSRLMHEVVGALGAESADAAQWNEKAKVA